METSQEAEFAAFVTGRAHALLKTAYALTGDRHAAEDLVQTALAKAFARWRRIDDPEPYLRRMIYNDFVSGRRSLRSRAEITMAKPPDYASGRYMESDTALRLLLRDALQTLPLRQRAVLILRYSRTSASKRQRRCCRAAREPSPVRRRGPWPSCAT